MDISYVKKVIKLLENSTIDEIELEEEGKKLRVARNRTVAAPMSYQMPIPMAPAVPPSMPAATSTPTPAQQVAEKKKYHEVLSPIVGTFYRAPSPEAEPYVSEGQPVKAGQVLCIVEAMKLMNEIDSDVDGTVVKIMVENGKPVEYNQVLFLVDRG